MKIPFLPQYRNEKAEVWLKELNLHLTPHEVCFIEHLSETEKNSAEFAIVANPPNSELEALPNLKWLHSTWAGVENVLNALCGREIELVRCEDPGLAQVMSESALTWSLYLYRRLPDYIQQQKQRCWNQLALSPISACKVTILGSGKLGAACAARLTENGFDVTVWGRTAKKNLPFNYLSGNSSLYPALKEADIIIVLLPLTNTTKNLMNKALLEKLKPGAAVVNFARGGLIDEVALQSLLSSGHLYHAVLDVFKQEPLPYESSLWAHPNVTVLPHISAPTNPHSAAEIIAENIKQYLKSGRLPKVVDQNQGY